MSFLGRLFRSKRPERDIEELALADTSKWQPLGREEELAWADTGRMPPVRAEGTAPGTREVPGGEVAQAREAESDSGVERLPAANEVVRRD